MGFSEAHWLMLRLGIGSNFLHKLGCNKIPIPTQTHVQVLITQMILQKFKNVQRIRCTECCMNVLKSCQASSFQKG